MYEPTLTAADAQTRRRRGATVALLALGVLAAGFQGWLLLSGAPEAAPDSPVSYTSSERGSEEGGKPSRPAPAARATAHVRITPDEDLAVSASYSFSQPVGQVWLTVPPGLGKTGHEFSPSITRLRVSIPGRPERRISGALRIGSHISVPIPVDATEVHFEYLVKDAVTRSIPSSRGRAVALLTPPRRHLEGGNREHGHPEGLRGHQCRLRDQWLGDGGLRFGF